MNNAEKSKRVIKELVAQGKQFEILSGDDKCAKHIRVKGFGDIWPSSGTFSEKGKVTKKNYRKLFERLGSTAAGIKQPSRYDQLELRIRQLESMIGGINGGDQIWS